MELCFVWISNGFFQQQGFNFDKDFHFDVLAKNNEEFSISMKEKIKLPKDFYGKIISNITAIVGKNGSGKTSILRILRKHLGRTPMLDPSIDIITIYKCKNFFMIGSNFQYSETKKKITYDKSLEIICSKYDYECMHEENSANNNDSYVENWNMKFVFFSNYFDYNQEQEEDYEALVENNSMNRYIEDISKNLNKGESLFQALKEKEFRESLDFLCDYEMIKMLKSKINSIPDVLKLELDDDFQIDITPEQNDKIKEIMTRVKISKREVHKQRFEERLCEFIIQDIIRKNDIDLDKIKNVDSYIGLLEEIYKVIEINKNFKYKKLISNYKILIQNCENIKYKQTEQGNYCVDVHIFDMMKVKDAITEIYVVIRDVREESRFISIVWAKEEKGLSTGQYARFRFYYNIYNLCIKNNSGKRNIILFLDEIETYMHPEWQRSCIKDIIEFINIIFQEKVQIVLTTNGPFILSDIPVQNVNFIENINGRGVVTSGNNNKFEETFGQNIHTLLKKSFFMQDGTIGEFAKEKIKYVMEVLNSNDSEEILKNKESILGIIKIIGEPVTRKILENKFYDVMKEYSIEICKINNKIKSLEKERQALLLGGSND